MKRILSLDFGSKTVGVAVSDELRLIATPVDVIRRLNEDDVKETIDRVLAFVGQYGADTVVLGRPVNMNGTEGERVRKTEEFKRRLEKVARKAGLTLTVETFDERLTSKVVERAMIETGLRREKRREIVDKMAAASILESYLGYTRNNRENKGDNGMSDINKNELANGERGSELEEEIEIITLIDENGEEVDFEVIDEMELDGKTYLLVAEPSDEANGEDGGENEELDATIFIEIADGEELTYEEIEDDAEFERIADLFSERGGEEYGLDK